MSEEMIEERAREAWSRILNMDGGQPQAIAAGMWASLYAEPLLAAYNPNERLREAWQPIETAAKDYRDGKPPLLTWSKIAGYGLTYGPTSNGGYGHQTHWQMPPEPPALSPLPQGED